MTDTITIVVDAAVTGYGGWGITWVLLGVLAMALVFTLLGALGMAVTRGSTYSLSLNIRDSAGFVALFAAVAVGFSVLSNWIAYDQARASTYREARDAALYEQGVDDILIGSDAYALTIDGNTALYTATSRGNEITFHRITQ